MADKPYIEFRLNPDKLKEELLNLIPWPIGTIAREMYKNPNGSAIETFKQVGRETPFIGSLMSGEYGDAAKEALLFGSPVKLSKGIKSIRKRKDTEYYMDGDGHIYHETKDGLVKDSEGGEKYKGWDLSYLGRNLETLNKDEAIKYLEDSEKASKFVLDNDLKFASELELDNMSQATKDMRKEAQNLMNREYAIEGYSDRDALVQAAKSKPGLLKPDDEIYAYLESPSNSGDYTPLYVKEPNSNNLHTLYSRYDMNNHNKEPFVGGQGEVNNGSYLSPYKPYRNQSLDRRILESDKAKYRINHESEPDYIPYFSREQYIQDLGKADEALQKAKDAYIESMYGPFPDEIFTNTGRSNSLGEIIKYEVNRSKSNK